VENEFEYPVSVNGKMRFKITLPLDLTKEQVEEEVVKSDEMGKWLNGSRPKKVIVVPGRIVNVVI
jgi:leucyl-tRNA synthetase